MGTQNYSPEQLGMYKTEALQYSIYKNLQREINIITGLIQDMKTDLILSNYDLVVDCFDNYEARDHAQGWWTALKLSQPNKLHSPELLHIGISPEMTFAIEWAENYKVPTDITSGFDICTLEGASSFVKMVASIGSLVAQEYLKNGQKREFIGNKLNIREIK